MTDEDPSQDRIAELIERINQMDEMLRQQAWRLYHLEQRLGVTPPRQAQPAARPPHPAPRTPAPPPTAAPPSVTKDTTAPPPTLKQEVAPAPPAPPATQTPSTAKPLEPPPLTAPPETTAPQTPRETRSDDMSRREAMQTMIGAKPPVSTPPPTRPQAPTATQPLSRVAAPPPLAQARAKSRGDLEARIGGNWFQRIGAFAVALGIAFLLKLAYDNSWITQNTVLWICILVGVGFLVGGERLRPRYHDYAYVLTGLGILVLYICFYAAYRLLGLWEPVPAFIGMALVTATAALLAARYNALPIAVLGLIGGFVTPIVLSTGRDNEVGLFSYIALLDLGVLALAYSKQWRSLNYMAFAATVLMFLGWYDTWYTPEKLQPTMLFLSLFFGIFALLAVLYNVVNRRPTKWLDLAMVFANALLYFSASYGLLEEQYKGRLGLFAVLVSAFYLALGYFTYRRDREDRLLLYTFWGLAILFAVLAVPIQFSQHWVTMGWAIEGAILTWIGLRVNDRISRYGALIVFLIAVTHWLMVDMFDFAYHAEELFVPLLNRRALSCAVLVAALAMAASFYKRLGAQIEESERQMFSSLYTLGANALAVTLLTLDANDYFGQAQTQAYERAGKPGNFSATGESASLNNQRHLTLSALWSVYAAVALTVGVKRNLKPLRIAALLLLAATGVKLLFKDLLYYDAAWHKTIFNPTFAAFAAFITACAVGAWFYAKAKELDEEEKSLAVLVLVGAANLFAVIALSAEAIGHFERLKAIPADPSVANLENMKQFALSAVWIVYGTISCLIGIRRNRRGLRLASLGLLALAIVKLVAVDLQYYDAGWHTTILNPTFAAFALLIVALAIVVRFYSRAEAIDETERRRMVSLIIGAANLFAVIALSAEAIGHFERLKAAPGDQSVDYIENMKQFALSAVWIVYGAVSYVIGIRRNRRGLRMASLGLLALAAVKLIVVDLGYYNAEWHTTILNPTFAAFALLIMALVIVAWFYRYDDAINDVERRRMIPPIIGAANLLALISLSAEIIGHYERVKASLDWAEGVGYLKARQDNKMLMMLSVLWIVYGTVALIIGIRRNSKWLRVGALSLLALATIKVLAFDLSYYAAPWHTLVFNQTFVVFALLVAALAAGVSVYSRAAQIDEQERAAIVPTLIIAANLLAVLALSAESYGHYAMQIAGAPPGSDLRDLRLAQQLGLTVVWTIYGGALLTIGLVRRRPLLRMMALLLLAMTIVKVYVLDIWSLTKLYRIIALILLGIVLLLVSFLYQPLRRRLAETETDTDIEAQAETD
jgi:uncharacterized membrane protein